MRARANYNVLTFDVGGATHANVLQLVLIRIRLVYVGQHDRGESACHTEVPGRNLADVTSSHAGVRFDDQMTPCRCTLALTNATLPWVLKLADRGVDELTQQDPHFANAVNMNCGTLTNRPVAEAHGLSFEPLPA